MWKTCSKMLLYTPISLLLTAVAVQGLGVEEWQKQSIYSLMTDRFARPANAPSGDCQPRAYCGGTWQGVKEKLDYIQGMGFTAIWISPISENIEEDDKLGLVKMLQTSSGQQSAVCRVSKEETLPLSRL